MSYVECRRTLLSESDRRFGGARLFRGQHARGGARRKVRLWCGISQRPRRALTDDGLKIPALASHLQNLRTFNEELRTALGVPTFYNEALGSVSQLSVYDRVRGRKGDVPDETVGAHSPEGGH